MTFPTIDSLDTLEKVLAAVGAVFSVSCAIIAATFKWIVKPSMKKARSFYLHVMNLHENIQKRLPIIDDIAKEFRPNGGNSLRDVVNKQSASLKICEAGIIKGQYRHRALIGALELANFECDADGDCIWVSTKWCQLMDLMPEQAKGLGWLNAVHPVDRQHVATEWENAREQRRESTVSFRTLAGLYIKAHATVLLSKEGEVIGYVGGIREVTQDLTSKIAV